MIASTENLEGILPTPDHERRAKQFIKDLETLAANLPNVHISSENTQSEFVDLSPEAAFAAKLEGWKDMEKDIINEGDDADKATAGRTELTIYIQGQDEDEVKASVSRICNLAAKYNGVPEEEIDVFRGGSSFKPHHPRELKEIFSGDANRFVSIFTVLFTN